MVANFSTLMYFTVSDLFTLFPSVMLTLPFSLMATLYAVDRNDFELVFRTRTLVTADLVMCYHFHRLISLSIST